MGNKKEKRIDADPEFTVDSDRSQVIEVPSISILLNRRKPQNSKKIDPNSPPKTEDFRDAEPSLPSQPSLDENKKPTDLDGARPEISLEGAASLEIEHNKLDSSRSGSQSPRKAFEEWNPGESSSESQILVSLATVISEIQGFLGLVHFESSENGNLDSTLLHAVGGIGAQPLIKLWDGMKWKPKLSADLRERILQQGLAFLESDDPLFRGIGGRSNQFAYGIRVGTESEALGIMLIISAREIDVELNALLPQLQSLKSAA